MYNQPTEYSSLNNVKSNTRAVRDAKMSQAGELNAISNYIYQEIVFADYLPNLADTFEKIALVEMKHYEILGELIQKLGGNPAVRARVINNQFDNDFEDTEEVENTAKKALYADIHDEEKASADYYRLAQTSNDPAVAAIYQQISEDEAGHAALLKQTLSSL